MFRLSGIKDVTHLLKTGLTRHQLSDGKSVTTEINFLSSLCFCKQPKIVEALLGYELVQVSCGASHVLAVTNEREVFAWGRGDNGIINDPFHLYRSLSSGVYARLIYDRNISAHRSSISSVSSDRSPRARHPRHPQLSTASVFTGGI